MGNVGKLRKEKPKKPPEVNVNCILGMTIAFRSTKLHEDERITELQL